MPKKTSSASAAPQATTASTLDADLVEQVRASAQQIWLAGLGAFSKVQAEGSRVFESLVQDGTTLQHKTQAAAEDKLAAVSAQVTRQLAEVEQKVEAVSAQAAGQWDRLGQLFEQRVATALGRLGVPQASDVQALVAQVAQLRTEVAQLRAAVSPPARPRRAASAPAPSSSEGTAPDGTVSAVAPRRTPKA